MIAYRILRLVIIGTGLTLAIGACTSKPVPGPDKQFASGFEGAALGAGSGAVTGFHVGAGTGPGAAVGAGLGAVMGGVKGALQDSAEERMMRFSAATQSEREIAQARERLAEHYQRRVELHPTRDIFPADWFFDASSAKLKPSAYALVQEIVRMNLNRAPWSRLVIAAYAKAAPPKVQPADTEGIAEVSKDAVSTDEPSFAAYLTERRSRELFDYFVHAGMEPRRIQTRAMVIKEPILIDPNDNPRRYNQAIELILIDR